MNKLVKSPLRYPGGKSRAIKTIKPLVPSQFHDYREPFIGGGSVFLALKSDSTGSNPTLFEPKRTWAINDLNPDVVSFWQALRDDVERLCEQVSAYRERYQQDGRALYHHLIDPAYPLDTVMNRAVRFFIMNRITFSGVMDAGGFSEQAFESRFTASSIERLRLTAPILANTTITEGDYEPLLFAPGESVFIFLDPPYYSATDSKLYGKKGALHTGFDHVRFADNMRRCPHHWLITYDDSPFIRELFAFATIHAWELQYGMNNYKQGKAEKGRELFITNPT
ncbi:MAG: DNA adenine methylase [Anaerolineae bacterium]|jgi:DNA adenine methylase|nr:DNA adenine methylase [Anaerolineae bacterium]